MKNESIKKLNEILTELCNEAWSEAESRFPELSFNEEDKEFLLACIQQAIPNQIRKFVNGAIEHNDSVFTQLSTADHIIQALNESIDLPFYLHAALRNLRRGTRG